MSDLEDMLLQQLVDAGIPEPVREYRFAKSIGRQWRFDAAYPDKLVAIEVEGGIWVHGRHNRGAGYEEDLLKYATATVMGWRVLRFGSKLIKSGDAVEMIGSLLARLEDGAGEKELAETRGVRGNPD